VQVLGAGARCSVLGAARNGGFRAAPGVTDAAIAMRPPLGRPSGITTYRVLPGARTGPIRDSLPVVSAVAAPPSANGTTW
jgi:hypothetical protein